MGHAYCLHPPAPNTTGASAPHSAPQSWRLAPPLRLVAAGSGRQRIPLVAVLTAFAMHALLLLGFWVLGQHPVEPNATCFEVSLQYLPEFSGELQNSDEHSQPSSSAQARPTPLKPKPVKSSPIPRQEASNSNPLESGFAATPQAAQSGLPDKQPGEQTEGQTGGQAGGQPSPLANNPKPPYPELARKRGQQGLVLLDVEVDELGKPVNVAVKNSSGYILLDDAALKTIRKWRFKPAQLDGKSASGKLVLPVEFRLED